MELILPAHDLASQSCFDTLVFFVRPVLYTSSLFECKPQVNPYVTRCEPLRSRMLTFDCKAPVA